MLENKKILITGGAGFLGKHLVDVLSKIVPIEQIFVARSREYDLREKDRVERLFERFSPDIVVHLATTAGGIGYNKEHCGKLYYDHIMMNSILMDVAMKRGVKKFLAVGTALGYPKNASMPLNENDIWEGYPEDSMAYLGLVSKMMLVQAQSYRKEFGFNAIYVILANLYGPGDHFSKERSHVIPATIMKFDEAIKNGNPRIEMWGSGKASREFLYVIDAAEGIVMALESYDKPEPLNLGSSKEITIGELIEKVSELMNFPGEISWDPTKPEGQLRRCMDNSRIINEIGFKAKTDFDEGLKETINWYIKNKDGAQS